MKFKGIIKNFKIKNLKCDKSRNIYRNFSGVLVGSQFSFRQFLVPGYISSQGRQAPSNAQSMLTTGFNLLHLSLPEQFPLLCLFWLSLFASLFRVSNFHPDPRGRRWSLIQAPLFSCAGQGEEHCRQISLVCVGSAHSVWTPLGLPQLRAACAFQVYTAQAPGCSAGELSKAGPAFRALPRSKPFRFSDTPQRHRLGWACIL